MIAAVVVVIVVILAAALAVGLGVVRGKSITLTTTVIQSQTIIETQTLPVTQTVLSTVSLPGSNSTATTTLTSVSISRSTVAVPTTINNTVTEESTVSETATQTVSSTSFAVVDLLPTGSLIVFEDGQRSYQVNQASIVAGFDGYFEVVYSATNSTAVQWVLQGNGVNETAPAGVSGDYEFPVQADVRYNLVVYNGDCTPYVCGNAFNVTALVSYVYQA